AALLSDASVAERLRQLIGVRDLVDGLPRPETSYDLVIPVLDRIAATRWRRALRGLAPRGRAALIVTSAAFGAAAAVFIAAMLLLNFAPRGDSGVAFRPHRAPAPAVPTISKAQTTPSSHVIAQSDHAERKASASKATGSPSRSTFLTATTSAEDATTPKARLVRRVVAGPDAEEIQSDEERLRLQGLLFGDTSVRRLLVTGDNLDSAASQVDGLLRNAPRRKAKYSRITISQGIVIDPSNPAGAIVYILVMDEKELGYLRTRLKTDYRLSVRDDGPAPAPVVTLLADIGQVSVAMGTPAATLMAPPENMASAIAMRARGDSNLPQEELHGPGFRVPGAPGPEAARVDSSHADSPSVVHPSGRDETAPASPAAADRLATVLVWVNAREDTARK
ncbi:MAG TPA: hypothetical protein VGZ22_22610, partial [Isosphaeraceae bacterium]|nr:hypothetical protein [Isosphaeraceae bacterium]